MNEDENPVTLEEWQEYVNALPSDEELYAVAKSAGSIQFGEKLMSEGYSAEDVSSIRKMLAQKMVEDVVAPPGRVDSCVIDYRRLADFPF